MITRLILGVSLPLVLGAQSDWQPFAPKEGGFSVLLPGTPTEHKQKVRTQAGNIAVRFFLLEKDERTFVVGFSDFPKKTVKAGSEEERLNNARQGAAVSAKGKVESEKTIKLGKHPGREILIRGESSFVRTRIYVVDNRLYQTMVLGSKEQARSKEAERFLESFQLTK